MTINLVLRIPFKKQKSEENSNIVQIILNIKVNRLLYTYNESVLIEVQS